MNRLESEKKEKRKSLEYIVNFEAAKVNVSDIVRNFTDYLVLTHEMVNDFIEYIEIKERHKENQEPENNYTLEFLIKNGVTNVGPMCIVRSKKS